MKKLTMLCILVLVTAIPAVGLADITQSNRLLQRPEWDGAVMPSSWIDGQMTYENWDGDFTDATVWSLGATYITSLPTLPKLELGGRMDFMHYDPENWDSEDGLSDFDAWGKYQLYQDSQVMIAAGLLITLPTGSEDINHPHASGEFNVEAFGAARFNVDNMLALIGHLAIRQNSDMDFKVGNIKTKVDGETQFEVGGGAIYQLTPELNLQGELNFATEAYDDFKDDIQLRGGVEYAITPAVSFRSGVSIGLADGAPDWALTVHCAYLF